VVTAIETATTPEAKGDVTFPDLDEDGITGLIVPAGEEFEIFVTADIASNPNPGRTIILDLDVSEVDAEDEDGDDATVTNGVDVASGATFTLQDLGGLTVTLDNNTPDETIIIAGTTDVPVGVYEFTATNEDVDVEDMTVLISEPATAWSTNGATASRTITVGAAPADGETITIGQCVVTFAEGAGVGVDNSGYASEEVDCGDDVAEIGLVTAANPGVALTAAQVSAVIDTLVNVTDPVQGALAVGAGGAATTVFTAPAELDGDITFTDGTGGDITATTTKRVLLLW
jgi:hypothetical protein